MKARKSKPSKIDRCHEIPNNDTDCDRIYVDEGNIDWRNRTTKEVKSYLSVSLEDSSKNTRHPLKDISSSRRTCSMNQNMIFVKKRRLVGVGNILGHYGRNTSSSMVKNSSMRLLLILAAANRLQVEGGEIYNVYLNILCGGKPWAVVGPEFGCKEGMETLVNKALHGLKTSGMLF